MLGAAGALLIVSLFLPWYETSGQGTVSGFEALSVVDVILAFVAAFAISVAVATAAMRVAAVPIALDALASLLSLPALVLVLIRALDLPDVATGREFGLWLALAGAVGIAVGGALAMRDERLSPPGRYVDATGRPVPKPPEIEPHPAPPPGSPS